MVGELRIESAGLDSRDATLTEITGRICLDRSQIDRKSALVVFNGRAGVKGRRSNLPRQITGPGAMEVGAKLTDWVRGTRSAITSEALFSAVTGEALFSSGTDAQTGQRCRFCLLEALTIHRG